MISLNDYVNECEKPSPWSKTVLGGGRHNWEHNGDYKYIKTLLN